MKKAESVTNRGWYFDLLLMEKHRLKDSTPMTPAMSLIFALDLQLDRILEEGLENRFARHAAMSKSHAGLGDRSRHGTPRQRSLSLEDRGHGQECPQLGYQRAEQIPADPRHAHRQRLRQDQRPHLPRGHHGRNPAIAMSTS